MNNNNYKYTEPREKPSKKNKLPPETTQINLLRRLEEYAEFAYNCKHFSDLEFYKELIRYIENEQ